MQISLELDQFQCLEKAFYEKNCISLVDERKLAAQTGLTTEEVQTWFMNRRNEILNRKTTTRPDVYIQQQLELLEKSFLITRYPDIYVRKLIAFKIGLTEPQVRVWFENHREKARNDELASQKSAARSMELQMAKIRGNDDPCGSCGVGSTDNNGLTSQQLESIEKKYTERKYLTRVEREDLAAQLGATVKQIRLWFQKRRQMEQNYNNLVYSQALATTPKSDLIPKRMPKMSIHYTSEQLELLEKKFADSKFIQVSDRQALALETDLTEVQVKIWFQNERIKENTRINEAKLNEGEISENLRLILLKVDRFAQLSSMPRIITSNAKKKKFKSGTSLYHLVLRRTSGQERRRKIPIFG